MGRKIPGKKHRSIKDPYKQRQTRLDSLKLKLNNPPSNDDEQEIPKSLLRIMELKQEGKKSLKKKTKKKGLSNRKLSVEKVLDKDPIQKGMTKPEKYIPNLVQKPNESIKSFFRRVSLMTQNLINEVEFEKKFGVEIKRNEETGEVIEVKNLKIKNVKSKKKKLSAKRKERLELRKENMKNVKDFSLMKDNIEFGEIVHRPPNLPNLKLKSDKNINKVKKPKYSNLLLNNFIENNKGTDSKNLMRNLEKEKEEKERKFIVEAYRRLKKK